MKRALLIVLILSLLTVQPGAGQRTPRLTAWPSATPEAAEVQRQVLDSISREIARGDYGYVDRMVVIRGGRLVHDASYRHDYEAIYRDSARTRNPLNASHLTGPYNYFNPWWHPYYRRGDLHTLQSVTKTIVSVVIGTAVTRGDFPSIDTPVLTFFDSTKVRKIDARKRRLTVRHLLTMTGGLDWNEDLPYIDPQNTAIAMEASHDWVQYTIDRPMAREPGSEFRYSSGEAQLLAHIFHGATGIDIEEYASRHLFGPLGIERWFWKRTPTGLVDTEGGLYLEALDLAKIWYLFLDEGEWNGTRVVSADWVKASVTPIGPAVNRPGATYYGLMWWLHQNPVDTTRLVWAGSGFGGQFPLAFPERDLIVVFNGWNILPGGKALPLHRMLKRLAHAVAPSKP